MTGKPGNVGARASQRERTFWDLGAGQPPRCEKRSRRVESRVFGSEAGSAKDPRAQSPSSVSARSQKRALVKKLEASWQENAPIPAEQMLSGWPTNPQTDPDVASLL